MKTHLQAALDLLKKKLLFLSSDVEKNFNLAVRALTERNSTLAKEVAQTDHLIDLYEVEVEEECLKILALHQPVASDLRYIVAALKINNDLERIADLAVNIAERALRISAAADIRPPFDVNAMAGKTRDMVSKALDSLIQLNADGAQWVRRADDEVDMMNREVYEIIFNEIRKTPENLEVLIDYLSVSKHLERIADYATNIAEDVLYMIEGQIIRHGKND